MDKLQMIIENGCTTVWSDNINMIRYLKGFLIYNCKVKEADISRTCSEGLILDTLKIKQNKFRDVVEEIRKLGYGLKNREGKIYTFEKEN